MPDFYGLVLGTTETMKKRLDPNPRPRSTAIRPARPQSLGDAAVASVGIPSEVPSGHW
jgi:hypothetical protein